MNTRIVYYKHRITLQEWVHIVQKAINELIEGVLRVVTTRIAKLQLLDDCSGLRKSLSEGYSPLDHDAQVERESNQFCD